MNLPHHVYCIGLGGIGVSAIAKYYALAGVNVSGSDAVYSAIIDEAVAIGVRYVGVDNEPSHLTDDVDLVVYTDACRPDHPELMAARSSGKKTITFSQALANLMKTYKSRVVISGTHGKSTTSAITGLLLVGLGADPTVLVGSRVKEFNGNLRIGRSQLIVAEADEWRDHYHVLQPTILTITNIEHDHPDHFPNPESVIESFQFMVSRLSKDGSLIINLDDPNCTRWATDPRVVTVSNKLPADLEYRIERTGPAVQSWSVVWRGQPLGSFTLHVPGKFNVTNAACAMATVLAGGADPSTFATTLNNFFGIWRRFEVIRLSQPTIINDYAHHPTAVAATIQAAREFYPERKIITIFQPHHHERLTILFEQFVSALSGADRVILLEVYAVLGREHSQGMKTSADLCAAINRTAKKAMMGVDLTDIHDKIKNAGTADDVILLMGAGDIWTMAEPLAQYYD